MLKQTRVAVAIIVVIPALTLLVDWQLSRGSVVTKDGVSLVEDNRLRMFESAAFGGVGITGDLTVLPNGCVGLTMGPSDGPIVSSPVIFKHGTQLLSGKPLRVKFGGRTYTEGAEISGGGNLGTSASDEAFFDQIPKSCRDGKFIRIGADD